jgi:hypothetical protein
MMTATKHLSKVNKTLKVANILLGLALLATLAYAVRLMIEGGS